MPRHHDIRGQLREDHDAYLAELEALRGEADVQRCKSRLRELRHAWAIHSLAEESVVYRAIEGDTPNARPAEAYERFIEHELIDGLFEALARGRPGTPEWHARLKVGRDLLARHVEHEHNDLFARLERELDSSGLRAMADAFMGERERLAGLEDPKAA